MEPADEEAGSPARGITWELRGNDPLASSPEAMNVGEEFLCPPVAAFEHRSPKTGDVIGLGLTLHLCRLEALVASMEEGGGVPTLGVVMLVVGSSGETASLNRKSPPEGLLGPPEETLVAVRTAGRGGERRSGVARGIFGDGLPLRQPPVAADVGRRAGGWELPSLATSSSALERTP